MSCTASMAIEGKQGEVASAVLLSQPWQCERADKGVTTRRLAHSSLAAVECIGSPVDQCACSMVDQSHNRPPHVGAYFKSPPDR